MTLAELLPTLQALPRTDKLHAIQFLADELAKDEEDISPLKDGAVYPIYTPYDCYEAAAVLRRVLEEERNLP